MLPTWLFHCSTLSASVRSHRTKSAPAPRGSRRGLLVEPHDAIVGEKTLYEWGAQVPELPVTRTSGCGVGMQTPSCLKNVQIHHRDIAGAGDGVRASFLPGPAGLDSSAADPGMALAQVQDEAWELEVAPAQERAPGARASGSCQSSYAESAPLPRQHRETLSPNIPSLIFPTSPPSPRATQRLDSAAADPSRPNHFT
jgi:hypothetical protein